MFMAEPNIYICVVSWFIQCFIGQIKNDGMVTNGNLERKQKEEGQSKHLGV